MSFSLIPPEINSALMASGAGSGPLLEASAAWSSLAVDLESTATQYQTLITNLVTGSWLGPSSAQMASATAPYIAWLQGTAATAAQTGAQAEAAAGAYQSAYASMVPLPVIEANRTELATLVANNFLGQNTGAIATNEAEYLDMWIQDALTMDTYQVNSQAASLLPAQSAAPQVASGTVANAAAATWCAEVDAAVHSELCAVPDERLVAEREVLAPLPSLRPEIGTASVTPKVARLSCIRYGSARYSVPTRLIGTTVAIVICNDLAPRLRRAVVPVLNN